MRSISPHHNYITMSSEGAPRTTSKWESPNEILMTLEKVRNSAQRYVDEIVFLQTQAAQLLETYKDDPAALQEELDALREREKSAKEHLVMVRSDLDSLFI